MQRRWTLPLLSALLVLAASGLALGSVVPREPKRPPNGRYQFDPFGAFSLVQGKGKHKKDQYATHIHMTPVPTVSCPPNGTPIEAIGKYKLKIMERDHVQSWAVGRNTPKTSDGISTVPAKLKVGGIPTPGKIKITFYYANPRELLVGEFEFAHEGGTCMASTYGGQYLGK